MTSSVAERTQPSVFAEGRALKSVVLSSMVGNALEWYDFALYGYFSTLLAHLFFPMKDPVVSLMATYGAFAAGFVMRPLGGVIFGYIGDRIGRKKALLWSIYLMSFPTFAIGLLPTYQHIGWLAPLLLTFVRMLQGVSMGGGFTGSIIFIVEHAENGRRGFWGSFAPLSAILGILLGASLAVLLSTHLPVESFESWGWRLPFLLSILGGWVGSYMRHALGDPKSFQKQEAGRPQSPLALYKSLWTKCRTALITIFCVDFLVAIGFYIVVTFLVAYLERFVGLSRTQALGVNIVGMISFAATIPLAGYLSDLWGRKGLMFLSAVGFFLFSVPLFYGLLSGNWLLILLAQGTLGVLMGIYFAIIPAVLVEAFPSHVRYSGISIAHNMSMALFGGSAPFVVTWLIHSTSSLIAPAFYLMLASGGALIGLYFLKDQVRSPLS